MGRAGLEGQDRAGHGVGLEVQKGKLGQNQGLFGAGLEVQSHVGERNGKT